MQPSFRCDQRPAYSRPYGADPVPTPQSHSPIRREWRMVMHEGGFPIMPFPGPIPRPSGAEKVCGVDIRKGSFSETRRHGKRRGVTSPALRRLDRWVTGSSSCLGLGRLLRGRDGPDLLHHPQRVPVLPLLHDLALFDTMDGDPCDSHLIARGCDAHQFALVGTPRPPTADDLGPFGYIVLQRYAQIGKGGTYHGDELLHTLYATNVFVGFVHDDVVGVHLPEGII